MSSSSTTFEKLAVAIAAVLAVIAIIFIGYVNTHLDHETQTTVFLKKFPTFKMEFRDVFATESDRTLLTLTQEDRDSFADYCKYRFGLTDTSDEGLEFCKENIPNYLDWGSSADSRRDMLFQMP